MFNRDRKNVQNIDAFVEERLSDYIDGTLSEQDRALVEKYLAESESARASLASLRYTVNLLKQAPAPALPRQFTLPVTARATAQNSSGWMVWALRGLAVGATAAFAILFTALVLRPPSASETANTPAQSPVAAVALALTPTPLLYSAQPTSAPAASANAPIMITAEPPASDVVPMSAQMVTETPVAEQTQRKSTSTNPAPSQSKSAATEVPTDAPQILQAQAVAPTETAVVPFAGAAAASSPAATPMIATDAAQDNSSSVHPIEGLVSGQDLHVRRGPGPTYRAVGVLKQGDVVSIVGRSSDNTWLVIQYPKNTENGFGWVDTSFIQTNEPTDTLPIVQPPAPGKPELKSTPAFMATVTPAP